MSATSIVAGSDVRYFRWMLKKAGHLVEGSFKLILCLGGVIACMSLAPLSLAGEKDELKASPDLKTLQQPMFVVHFSRGPAWNPELEPQEQKDFKAHSQNLNRLRKSQKILFGARYGDFGMIFISADTLDAARSIIEQDAGVRAGIFSFTISELRIFYPWRS